VKIGGSFGIDYHSVITGWQKWTLASNLKYFLSN